MLGRTKTEDWLANSVLYRSLFTWVWDRMRPLWLVGRSQKFVALWPELSTAGYGDCFSKLITACHVPLNMAPVQFVFLCTYNERTGHDVECTVSDNKTSCCNGGVLAYCVNCLMEVVATTKMCCNVGCLGGNWKIITCMVQVV